MPSAEWRVGILFSRSGITTITESEHFLGTALAIEEINKAGGILGRWKGRDVAHDRPGSTKRVAAAVGEGAAAVSQIHAALSLMKKPH